MRKEEKYKLRARTKAMYKRKLVARTKSSEPKSSWRKLVMCEMVI